MCPIDFAASYANKQVPPPKEGDQEDEWTDDESGNNAESVHNAETEVILATVATSATNSSL